jgi:tRNA threonylcarbamoyladenosine biosynthesis protein TsaB
VEKAHASRLTLLIDELMLHAGVGMAQLEAVAVSAGPGSYTGLRIGATVAKGLAFTLSIPLIAVDTLKQMAASPARAALAMGLEELLLCPMIDARRMEVYTAIFDVQLHTIKPVEALPIEADSLLFEQPLLIFGDGAAKCVGTLQGPDIRFLPDVVPSAREMGPLAFEAFRQQHFADVAYFEPLYLKEFIAKQPSRNKPLA